MFKKFKKKFYDHQLIFLLNLGFEPINIEYLEVILNYTIDYFEFLA